jgi:hypothetical protein
MKNKIQVLIPSILMTAGVILFLAFRPAPAPVEYEYRQFSTVESIVPGGLGRSRIVSTSADGSAIEKELMNLYSMVGINFGNIANNDKLIVDKVNEYTKEGWELFAVTTGVQSPSEGKGQGIYMTRFLFRKAK